MTSKSKYSNILRSMAMLSFLNPFDAFKLQRLNDSKVTGWDNRHWSRIVRRVSE